MCPLSDRGHSSHPGVIYWGHSAARNIRVVAVCPLADIGRCVPFPIGDIPPTPELYIGDIPQQGISA
ncbi:MAG: hypothetical protein HPY66_2622 [Firmicutes bacterium]|nr:hypothetical protein [Bacillota bacterium]